MKKYLVFCIAILSAALLFASCGIKGDGKPETTSGKAQDASLDSSDLPTVTDDDGNVVDYTGKIDDGEQESDVSSPYLSVGSLEEINRKAGTSIKSPEGIEVTNEEFDFDDTVSPNVASYTFTAGGKDYTAVASRQTGAMLLNIYLADGTALGEGLEDDEPLPPTQYDGFCAARWFSDGVQYNLYADSVTLSEFKSVYSKMK